LSGLYLTCPGPWLDRAEEAEEIAGQSTNLDARTPGKLVIEAASAFCWVVK
jgi:hypothetical protein